MNIFSDKVKAQKLVDTDMARRTLVMINGLIKIGIVFYHLTIFSDWTKKKLVGWAEVKQEDH